MGRSTTKLAVTVGAAVFERVEALRERSGESRGGLIDRALRALLAEDERRRRIAEYGEANERLPAAEHRRGRSRHKKKGGHVAALSSRRCRVSQGAGIMSSALRGEMR